jgi:hypothetical protein
MTIRLIHSNDVTTNRADIATRYTDIFFDDVTNSILLPDPTGLLETKIGATGSSVAQFPGYKGVCVDDGVEVSLDSLVVKLNTGNPRSLQFKVSSGTISTRISGEIYWANSNYTGNYGANYWAGDTLNTTWQQIFGWNFPWEGDKAVYNVIDRTNKRLYRITLIIGAGYKNNFIIMERLV